jgi:hypothetical protein
MIRVLEPTATMTMSHAGARPGVSFSPDQRQAVLHLSRNSGSIISGIWKSNAKVSAMRITASVNVQADAKDNFRNSGWRFHFLQFLYLVGFNASYAGKNPAEGSMYLDFSSPPVYPGYADFLLDTEPKSKLFPFWDMYSPQYVQTEPGLWRVTITMDDHPFDTVPLRLPNFVTRQDNFLYNVFKEFQIVTTFVARDINNGGDIVPLAWVDWGAIHNASFRWSLLKSGDLDVAPPQMLQALFYDGGQVFKGAPTGRGLAAMVTDPPSDPQETYNATMEKTVRDVLGSVANSPNVSASTGWPSSWNFPRDHFKVTP